MTPPTQIPPAPLLASGLHEALRAARARPQAHVHALLPGWPEVDRARDLIAALGLDDRITVRPAIAAPLARNAVARWHRRAAPSPHTPRKDR